jgi:outer membrane receptor protein involved in Fe transport
MRKIGFLLTTASAMAFAWPGLAQESTSVSEVVVTGSRIVRNGNDAPTPVTVASSEQLQVAAPRSLTEALNQLPQFQSQAMSRGGNQASALVTGTHGNFINLRNLGINRTLVLMDGRRVPPTTYTGLVDVDVIPEMLVSRVEVVTGGASAVYGSDAVSGVVNYILDHDFVGVKAQAQYGVSQYGDGDTKKYGAAFGAKFADDRGHVMVAAERVTQRPVYQRDRPYLLQSPLFVPTNPDTRAISLGGAGPGGTRANPYKIAFNVVDDARNYLGKFVSGPAGVLNTAIQANGALRPWDPGLPTGVSGVQIGGDGVPSSPDVFAIGGLHTSRFFGEASYDVTPDIKAIAQVGYTKNIAFTNASGITATRFNIFSGNTFLPSAIQQQLTATNTASVLFSKRIPGSFPLLGQEVTKDWNFTAALQGKLFGDWGFNAYYIRGDVKAHVQSVGQYQNQRFFAAVDAVVNPANGQTVCRVTLVNPSLLPGCVPYNLFDPNGASQAAIDWVKGGFTYFDTRNRTDEFGLDVSGELFNLPAGAVRAALGFDYRKNHVTLTSNSDPAQVIDYTGIRGQPNPPPSKWSLSNFGALDGTSTVKEGFVEVDVPLLRDAPLAASLDITGAYRYTDYSQSGRIDSWKGGFSYAPWSEFRLRGTLSRDIRAPVITETTGQTRQVQVFTDIHTNTSTGQIPVFGGGNPDLKPEKGDTRSIGAVYQPRWLPRFSLSVDFYDIKISDAIAAQTFQGIVAACEASNGTGEECSLITRPLPFSDRSPANTLIALRVVPQNLSTLRNRGLDIEAGYNVDLNTWSEGLDGALTLRAVFNHTMKYNSQFSATSPLIHLAGYTEGEAATSTAGAVPKWKGQVSAQYKNEGFGLYLGMRYIGKLKGGPQFVYTPDHISPVVYFDTTLSYDATIGGADTELYVTVNNLFNKKYPLWPQTLLPGITLPTIISQYDVMLRYFTFGVRAKF